jgi:SAM-dependent methyltransferase
MRVLDLGAGTGTWATALADWFDISVVAVEPSAAMRARSACPVMIGGDALALPPPGSAARPSAATDTRPVIDSLDLLVLRNAAP